MSQKFESERTETRFRSPGKKITAAFPHSYPTITAPTSPTKATRIAPATPSFMATFAALLLVAGGAIHGYLVPEAWGDAHYKGVLFALNALASLICALDIKWGTRIAGWFGGALVAVASLGAYVASRTIGLPDLPAEPDAWFEPLGVATLVAEAGFLLFFAREVAVDRRDFEPDSASDFDGDESDA